MEATLANPPAGAPRCWGRQFQKQDKECNGCTFNYTCEGTFRQASVQAPQGPWQGYAQPPPPPPYGQQPYWQPPPPPPNYRSLPVYGQQPQPPQQPWQPPPPPQHTARGAAPPGYGGYPQPGYQQQPAYAPAPDQFQAIFGQYPGEDIAERLGKNIILRALEAIFSELTRFFHYWTWPRLVAA